MIISAEYLDKICNNCKKCMLDLETNNKVCEHAYDMHEVFHIDSMETTYVCNHFEAKFPRYEKRGTVINSAVNHPVYYGGEDDPYEAIKVIEAWDLGFCLGNAVKYISRAGKKDALKTVEDLEKAKWYIERRIQEIEGDAE